VVGGFKAIHPVNAARAGIFIQGTIIWTGAEDDCISYSRSKVSVLENLMRLPIISQLSDGDNVFLIPSASWSKE
jgi:hypothetical protein